jgi:hypothetical protein
MDLDDLQKVKIIVDLGNGTKWTYENINSIIAEDKLISLENPNSTIYILNIESSLVTVTNTKNEEENEINNKKFIEKIKDLIKELNPTCMTDCTIQENCKAQEGCATQTSCTTECVNCKKNGCSGNCCC